VNWGEIRKEYETSSITLKALADKHDIKLGTLKSRKSREGWERDAIQKDATKPKKVATLNEDAKQPNSEIIESLVESEGLTDKQRLFCMYYVKTFNATQSAIKAGYSADTAHVQGPRLLGNVRVAEEIKRIKTEMANGIFIDAMDVLNKYIKIAFSDITDYLSFGRKEIEVATDDNGDSITAEVNYVEFKDSRSIDGTLVSEVNIIPFRRKKILEWIGKEEEINE